MTVLIFEENDKMKNKYNFEEYKSITIDHKRLITVSNDRTFSRGTSIAAWRNNILQTPKKKEERNRIREFDTEFLNSIVKSELVLNEEKYNTILKKHDFIPQVSFSEYYQFMNRYHLYDIKTYCDIMNKFYNNDDMLKIIRFTMDLRGDLNHTCKGVSKYSQHTPHNSYMNWPEWHNLFELSRVSNI